MKNVSLSSESDPKFDCGICDDRGYEIVKQEFNGRMYEAKKDCVCYLEKVRRKRLSVIPPKFANLCLAQIQPDESVHPLQKSFVPVLKTSPSDNFFLAGRFGTGKTLMMWMLYREAVMNDKRVVACTLTELLNEYKVFIQASISGGELVYPRLSSGDLRQNHTRFSIFLDDIDKAKPTEYVAEQFFELADAIYAFNHQIVITTNLTAVKLIEHFERADERYGGAIVRRLMDNAHRVEMF